MGKSLQDPLPWTQDRPWVPVLAVNFATSRQELTAHPNQISPKFQKTGWAHPAPISFGPPFPLHITSSLGLSDPLPLKSQLTEGQLTSQWAGLAFPEKRSVYS